MLAYLLSLFPLLTFEPLLDSFYSLARFSLSIIVFLAAGFWLTSLDANSRFFPAIFGGANLVGGASLEEVAYVSGYFVKGVLFGWSWVETTYYFFSCTG
jgi:hypothetical protein